MDIKCWAHVAYEGDTGGVRPFGGDGVAFGETPFEVAFLWDVRSRTAVMCAASGSAPGLAGGQYFEASDMARAAMNAILLNPILTRTDVPPSSCVTATLGYEAGDRYLLPNGDVDRAYLAIIPGESAEELVQATVEAVDAPCERAAGLGLVVPKSGSFTGRRS